jgi:ribosomal protein L11 methyltransferase
MYHCVLLELNPPQPATEIFIAGLAQIGFESFEETDTGLRAYIRSSEWDVNAFNEMPYWSIPDCVVSYSVSEIEATNWNAVWESEYQPIRLDNSCAVRANFHPVPDPPVTFDLVITPKMSFGTGHHETTWLMLQLVLDSDLKGLSVLDMGTGTGVLAILAAKKGAASVEAIDVDPWSYENCSENVLQNGHPEIKVILGDADAINGTYDVIIANINRNILLSDIPAYAQALNKGGQLLLSGFYMQDRQDLIARAASFGIKYKDEREKENWVALRLEKE